GRADADPGDTRAAARGAHGSPRPGGVPRRSDVRLRGADGPRGGRLEAARSAFDLARPGGVRPAGPQARGDVRRELQEVHARRRRPRGSGAEGLARRARSRGDAPRAITDASSRAIRVASSAVDAKHDVLVIGAGCAGMRAAIEAHDAGADVVMISKLHPTRSHSGAAEGGINAALGNAAEDSPEIHAFDTV